MATPWLTYAWAQDMRTRARRAVEQTLFGRRISGAHTGGLLNIKNDNKTIKYISPSNIFDRIRLLEGLHYNSRRVPGRHVETSRSWQFTHSPARLRNCPDGHEESAVYGRSQTTSESLPPSAQPGSGHTAMPRSGMPSGTDRPCTFIAKF
jgi:hypothetical protein